MLWCHRLYYLENTCHEATARLNNNIHTWSHHSSCVCLVTGIFTQHFVLRDNNIPKILRENCLDIYYWIGG